jgi:hypothetical protein
MDVDEYRRRYEDEAHQAKRAELRRSSRASADSTPTGTRDLVAAIKNTSNRPKKRIAAIDAASAAAVKTPSVINTLIKILADPAEDTEVREAALAALQQNTFSAVEFRRYAAAFRDALRSAVTDEDPELREQAMDLLALNGDEYVQRLLVAGLQNPKVALVKPQRALQMIGYDVHAEHYGLLRDIVDTSKQPTVRRTALTLLAADGDAKELFARIAADKSEDSAARSTSAIALQSLAPDDFTTVARDVVLDDDDDDKVRSTFITAMSHGSARGGADVDDKVRAIAESSTPSKQLKGAARQYLRVTGGET